MSPPMQCAKKYTQFQQNSIIENNCVLYVRILNFYIEHYRKIAPARSPCPCLSQARLERKQTLS